MLLIPWSGSTSRVTFVLLLCFWNVNIAINKLNTFPTHLSTLHFSPSIYLQFFPFILAALFADGKGRSHIPSIALVCLEGNVRYSWVIFLRWHHVMTQIPALTCKAGLKLHPAPEDKLCGRGVHSFRFQAFQGLTRSSSHTKGLLLLTVCSFLSLVPPTSIPIFINLFWKKSCLITTFMQRGTTVLTIKSILIITWQLVWHMTDEIYPRKSKRYKQKQEIDWLIKLKLLINCILHSL